MSNPTGREARRHSRVEMGAARLNATLAILSANKVTGCLVPVKDFSKTGAGVYLKFKLDPGTLVRLSIEGISLLPVEGRAVWCTSSADDPHAPPTHPFRIGIEFIPTDDASRENQLAIYNHVTKLVGS